METIKLIQPAPVVRDENGMFQHPDMPDRYFESHDPNCSYWDPDRPDGEGWFCLAIHDTDDGPVCWWARREVTP